MTRMLLCALFILRLGAEQKDEDLPKVLWRDPGQKTIQDWICGPGGCDHTPAPPFHFVKEELTGTNPKVLVRDAKDQTWSVKLGNEAIPECFASRFVTAIGYGAEPTYFVANGKIEGLGKLQRARWIIHKDGTFTHARFELRGQKDFVFLPHHSWAWDDNPFRGTHELAGLKIVMMLLTNWDAKDAHEGDDSNNSVFRVESDGIPMLLYAVSDWGASLGRWGAPQRRDRSDCAGFAIDTPHFAGGVRQNEVLFGFSGKHEADIKKNITVEDVRWLLPHLSNVTPEKLRAGLKAAGATDRQTTCWAHSIEQRIRELQAAGTQPRLP